MPTIMNRKFDSPKYFVFAMILLFSIFLQLGLHSIKAQAVNQSEELNKPVPPGIRKMLKEANELAESDQPEKALAILERILSLAPNYLQAHKNYIFIKIYHLDKYDEVRAEYQARLNKEPNNPVYLMALALEEPLSPAKIKNERLTKVTEIAPDWTWASYAKARLLHSKKSDEAISELLKFTEKEPEEVEAFELLLQIQEKQSGRIDEAVKTAEKMIANPVTKLSGLKALWRLRLIKGQDSDDAKSELAAKLSQLASSARDVETLIAVYWAYTNLLKDENAAAKVEIEIKKLDPTWSKYRGVTTSKFVSTNAGLPRQIVTINKPSEFVYKIVEMSESLTAKEKMARLEEMLRFNPKPNVKFLIYSELLKIAEKDGDFPSIIKYAEVLRDMDPEGSVFNSKIALAYAELKTNLPKSIALASSAEKATAKFENPPTPVNTNPDWIKESFPENWLQLNYKWKRSIALEALGWAYFQTGNYNQAEVNLRQSSELWRSEKNLARLADTLDKLNRSEEAKIARAAAGKVFEEKLKARFIDLPSQDFELQTIDGRKVRLSDLKGKVVMLNFWAAWCFGCVKEAPELVKLYDKYKSQGFEILAISTESEAERYKVAQFVKRHNFNFPVLYNETAAKLYNVEGFPTNIFIDREGKVKYRSLGYFNGIHREYDFVINELIKK
ncbi:MAG: redoxin domain-containing protein [Acidobacteriota bacterium]|nr:redoxin domain-containing protein [Acidobacteriota bacterium]